MNDEQKLPAEINLISCGFATPHLPPSVTIAEAQEVRLVEATQTKDDHVVVTTIIPDLGHMSHNITPIGDPVAWEPLQMASRNLGSLKRETLPP